LIPDESKRKKALLHLFEFALRYGLLYGEGYATSRAFEGLAIWIPSKKAAISPFGMIRSGLLSLICRVDRKVMSRLFSCLYHSVSIQKDKAPQRYLYLFLLAVRPAFQGKGYASALLTDMLKRLDGEKLPCYLTTNNEANVPIYERHGFRLLTSHVISNTGVKHLAMLRECAA
jgi:ribosomal protein S18 acetylase RimI-like enzyme